MGTFEISQKLVDDVGGCCEVTEIKVKGPTIDPPISLQQFDFCRSLILTPQGFRPMNAGLRCVFGEICRLFSCVGAMSVSVNMLTDIAYTTEVTETVWMPMSVDVSQHVPSVHNFPLTVNVGKLLL